MEPKLYISNRFRDICMYIYLGHDLDFLGTRDVIGHETILIHHVPFPIPEFFYDICPKN